MASFTYMSDEAIAATVAALLASEAEPMYPLRLNVADFTCLMEALKLAWELGGSPLSEWAGLFASCISESLGIDQV